MDSSTTSDQLDIHAYEWLLLLYQQYWSSNGKTVLISYVYLLILGTSIGSHGGTWKVDAVIARVEKQHEQLQKIFLALTLVGLPNDLYLVCNQTLASPIVPTIDELFSWLLFLLRHLIAQ